MEQHGENPHNSVIVIIPARYASIRLPGKVLLPIAGKPLILHTVDRAKRATKVDRVIVATDDERILNVVLESGNEAVMTRPDHRSGSDRIAEVAESLPAGTIVVNVQGDEPLISPQTIDLAVGAMLNEWPDVVTVCEPLKSLHDELLNFNVVKAVVGEKGNALYFSRSPMPFPRDASLRYGGDPNRALSEEPELFENFRKHTGLYVYTREFLLEFTKLPQTRLEKFESLEQLRALENGSVIKVVDSEEVSIGVDTLEDLDAVRLRVEFPSIKIRTGTQDDIPDITRVYLKTVRESYAGFLPDDYLNGITEAARNKVFLERRASNESYHLFVADDEERGVVAFLDRAEVANDNFGFGSRIFSFYVLPEDQHRGLGGLLFRRALRQIGREGISSVCLDTFEGNPFRRFYEREGGTKIAIGVHDADNGQFPTVVYGWNDLSRI